MKNILIDYDKKADVMYFTFKKVRNAKDITAEEISNNVFVHHEDKTRNIIGVTIVSFSKLLGRKNGIKIPISL